MRREGGGGESLSPFFRVILSFSDGRLDCIVECYMCGFLSAAPGVKPNRTVALHLIP